MKCGARLPMPPAASAPSVGGAAPGAGVPPRPSQPPVAPSGPSNRVIYGVFAFAAVAIAVALGLQFSGILRAEREPPKGQLLAASAEPAPPGLLKVQREPAAGVAKVTAENKMPDDVRAWLQHLERVERRRRDLAMGQIGTFMASLTTMQMAGAMDMLQDLMGGGSGDTFEDPTAEGATQAPDEAVRFHETVVKSREDWRALLEEFASVPPPAECVPIRDAYERALRETSGMMMDLLDAMDRAFSSADPQVKQQIVSELNLMKGKSQSIDEAGRETNRMVQEICDKYETRKWFDVAGDIGGGGLLGGFGGR